MIVAGTVIINRQRYTVLFGKDDFDPPLIVRAEEKDGQNSRMIYDEDLINKVCSAVFERLI